MCYKAEETQLQHRLANSRNYVNFSPGIPGFSVMLIYITGYIVRRTPTTHPTTPSPPPPLDFFCLRKVRFSNLLKNPHDTLIACFREKTIFSGCGWFLILGWGGSCTPLEEITYFFQIPRALPLFAEFSQNSGKWKTLLWIFFDSIFVWIAHLVAEKSNYNQFFSDYNQIFSKALSHLINLLEFYEN